jgi:beta-glucanase (GH16 family)
MLGGKTHYFGFKDPSKNFMEYTVSWKKDKIEFYYGNRLVRTIDDKKILKQLSDTTMNVIINNGVTSDVDLSNPPHSNFVIKDFTYTPY